MRLWSSNNAINNPSSVRDLPAALVTQLRERRAALKPCAPPGRAIVRTVSDAEAAVVLVVVVVEEAGWAVRLMVIFSVVVVAAASARELGLADGRVGEEAAVVGAEVGWAGGGGRGELPPRTKRA